MGRTGADAIRERFSAEAMAKETVALLQNSEFGVRNSE
jgi:hypothetical protein